MKNQITIKRSGCFLPTFALVVIFLLVSALLWLSTVGLPQAATDYLTAKVKEETGLTLKVEKIRLSPLSGLGIKAEKVSLFEPGLPAVYIQKLKVSFDWDDLATGRFDLPHIRVRKGSVALAVGDTTDELLSLKNLDLDVEVRSPQSSDQLHLNGACDLQGINLKLTAIFPLQEKQKSANESSDVDIESSDVDIKATLADLKQDIRKQMSLLQQIQTETARQQWATPPTLLLVYSAESTQPVINITANLPNFDWRDIHIHHAVLVAENNGGQLKLNRLEFKTSAPDTTFIAKAEFNPNTMEGTFDMDSSASPVDIAKKHLREKTPAWLGMISHADGVTPHIRLKSDFRLAEDNELLNRYTAYLKPRESGNNSAAENETGGTETNSKKAADAAPFAKLCQIIKHLRIEGDIEQRGFKINDSEISSVVSGFYFEDGKFNIDKLNIELPDGGNLALVASLKDGNGQIDFQLNSDIDYLLHFATHFTKVSLPDGSELKGMSRMGVRVNLTMPDINWEEAKLQDMLPDVADIHLTAGIDQVKQRLTQKPEAPTQEGKNDITGYHDFQLTAPQISLSANRIRIDRELTAHISIENLKGAAELADLSYLHTEILPQSGETNEPATKETKSFLHNLTLQTDGCNLEFSQMDGTPVFSVASARAHAKISQAGHDAVTADECTIAANLPYGAATNIAPLSQLKGANLSLACKELVNTETPLHLEQPTADVAVESNDEANHPSYCINLTAAFDSLQFKEMLLGGMQCRTSVENPNLNFIEGLLANAEKNQKYAANNIVSHVAKNIALPLFDALHMQFDNKEFSLGNAFNSGNQVMSLHMDPAGKEESVFNLSVPLNGQELGVKLPLRTEGNTLSLHDAEITCPIAELQPLLKHFDPELCETITQNIELPKTITLRLPEVTYNTAEGRLTEANVSISVPELVRTPNAVPALRGKKVTVGVDSDLKFFYNDKGKLLYSGNLHVRHESGQLDAKVDGDIASYVHVSEGRNTIYADAIDLLIDDEDAHAIIRDFRFTPGKSKILADDIDTKVSYKNGIGVEVSCKADIIDTEYLLDAYTEQEENGIVREIYQEGITADSFTLFQHAHCGVEVKVLLDRKDENGNPLADEQTINLTDVELTSNNSRWFTQNNMGGKGLKTSTTIKGESILFNIENNTLTLSGLKGDSYPAYTIGTFYLPLRDYLSGILLTAPAQLETKEVVVPIATHCDVPMSGTIRVKIPNGGRYDLQGTIIPVEQFSGFVTLFDDHVYLDKLNSSTWGGVLNGQLSIGFNDTLPAFDGYFVARAMDLRRIAKAFDSDFKPAVCAAEFRFRAKNAELTSLEGYGAARVSDGDLMEIPLFSPVSYVITHLPEFIADKATDSVRRVTGRKDTKETPAPQQEEEKSWWQRVTGVFTNPVRSVTSAVNYSADAAADKANSVQDAAGAYVPFANYVATYDLQDASAFFTLRNGFLYSDDVKASGSNLKVKLEMALNLTDMTINATLHPSFNSLLDVASKPFTVLSKYMLDINVSGPLSNLSWNVRLNNSEAIKKQMKDDVERLKKEAKDVEHAVGL